MIERFTTLYRFVSLVAVNCDNTAINIIKCELSCLKEVIDLLRPFDEATSDISGENYVTASKVLPLIKILNENLEQVTVVCEESVRLKAILKTNLKKRFDNFEQKQVLAIASTLDPRFKNFYFSSSVVFLRVKKYIESIPDLPTSSQQSSETEESTGLWSEHKKMVEARNPSTNTIVTLQT